MLAFFCAGWSLEAIELRKPRHQSLARLYDEGYVASGDPVEITGVLERPPESAPDGFYLTLRVERLVFRGIDGEVAGTVWLFAPLYDRASRSEYEEKDLRYGARIRLMVALRRAESFRNPGVSSLTEYLERKGYDAAGTIKSPLLVERLDNERVFLPLAWAYEFRQGLMDSIDESFSAETAGVLKAALLGNRFYLSRPQAERFREGGTFHILVISGLHISFIGGLIFLIMRRVTRSRALQFTVSALFLWCYAMAVGAESSVVRAALMFTMVALAPVLHRRASALNALGCAGLVLLVWRPAELFDPSFQLTFLSVLAIVAVAWPLLKRVEEIGAWRPARETPYPPDCQPVVRKLAEALFWRESVWRLEMKDALYSYRLRKSGVAPLFERWRVQGLLRYGFGALVVSMSVQVMLLPLFVLYFHRLSVASLILNIVVGAMMAALAFLSIAALLVSELSTTLAVPLVWLAEHLNWLMTHSVDPFSRARLASLRLPEYSGWQALLYALYYLPVAALAVMVSRWRPLGKGFMRGEEEKRRARLFTLLSLTALLALAAAIILHPFSARRPQGRLRVDFLDVGQGDAALVTMPDGVTLLVDAGGRPAYDRGLRSGDDGDSFERDSRGIGEAVVSEYLWWRGLDSVDYIVATHADADHIDGLKEIVRNFSVRAALIGRAPALDPEYAQFTRAASENSVPVYLIGRGDVLQLGEVKIDVLWPEIAASPEAPSRNDDSVVLRIRFGESSFLLTGDIERGAEGSLIKAQADLRSDVVKVAHHGSRTSSTESFVKATAAQIAVISVGAHSIFGHPHAEVLERWKASGAQVLVTGRSGTVTVSTDGRDLRVETYVQGLK